LHWLTVELATQAFTRLVMKVSRAGWEVSSW
jgi:hypothetical protein